MSSASRKSPLWNTGLILCRLFRAVLGPVQLGPDPEGHHLPDVRGRLVPCVRLRRPNTLYRLLSSSSPRYRLRCDLGTPVRTEANPLHMHPPALYSRRDRHFSSITPQSCWLVILSLCPLYLLMRALRDICCVSNGWATREGLAALRVVSRKDVAAQLLQLRIMFSALRSQPPQSPMLDSAVGAVRRSTAASRRGTFLASTWPRVLSARGTGRISCLSVSIHVEPLETHPF